MSNARTKQSSDGQNEAPFPLRRYFYLGVLPGLLLVIAAVVYATTQTVRSSTVETLLQLATQKVDGIAKGIESEAPSAWRKLQSKQPLTAADLSDLTRAFADEQKETQLALLKIYSTERKVVFATDAGEIGKIEDKPALRDALTLGTASVLVESDARGEPLYELYLPYRFNGEVAAVFELYEPVFGFDLLVWKVIRPILVIPISLFLIMLAGLAWLVGRGQADINLRTNLILSLRRRIERLVSHRAAAAMRVADAGNKQAELFEVTLFYSDVRGFTGFAEHRSPGDVIEFLNRIIGLQVPIIESLGGDVDKMIGDAVLARFHGPERAARAVDAAVAVQAAVSSSGLPLGVGIGLFGGPVVAGLIGAGNRFDYTVVGDAVNSAARLCGLAEEGEIIADSATAAEARDVSFGPLQALRVKGRAGELSVRRFKPGNALA
ncbi:hypothetical protein BH10PSE7_BH10PSE7_11350 [soil metagenome]